MGRTSPRKLLSSRLSLLIANLLILQHQPKRKLTKLRLNIKNLQKEIKELLGKNPSLKKTIEISFKDAYVVALTIAEWNTGINRNHFPDTCSFDLQLSLNTKLSSLRSQNQESILVGKKDFCERG
jgi:hypothetical protein